MNIILLENSDLIAPSTAILTGRRHEHLLKTLRAAVGSECRIGLRDGKLGIGTVRELRAERSVLQCSLDTEPPPPLPLTLVIALPRPKTYRKVLHAAATFGVKRICFVAAFKTDKSYWSSPWLEPDFIAAELGLAAEQSGDPRLPEVCFYKRFKPFIEDELPELAQGRTLYLAHPGAATALPPRPETPALLAVGPEGGFTDYEVRRWCEAGARPVTLGGRILRTEVALAALLGRWGC